MLIKMVKKRTFLILSSLVILLIVYLFPTKKEDKTYIQNENTDSWRRKNGLVFCRRIEFRPRGGHPGYRSAKTSFHVQHGAYDGSGTGEGFQSGTGDQCRYA